MEERAVVLTSHSCGQAQTTAASLYQCFLCGVYAMDMCVHCMLHTDQMVVCLYVPVCVEYLFDLCHGPRLITSADRWL